jgi:PHD/YefM family antitoxin component YafN of YafNO toxin-antitoxin module
MASPQLEISKARDEFNRLDERLKHAPVVYIMRRKKPAFAVVSPEYLSSLLETLEVLADPDAVAMLQQSLADIEAGRLHDHDELLEEYGLPADAS